MRNLRVYPITVEEKLSVISELCEQLTEDKPIPKLGIGDIRAFVLKKVLEDLQAHYAQSGQGA